METGKKGTQKKKWIIGGCLAGLGVLCLLMVAFLGVSNTPEKVLNRYIDALNAQKYEDMYALISPESQAKINKEDFVERYQTIYGGIGAKNITINLREVTRQDNGDQKVRYRQRMGTDAGDFEKEYRVMLTRKNPLSSYKITWDYPLILPGMIDKESKVRVLSLPTERGSLYDRHGNLLAGQGIASSVGLVPGKMGSDKAAESGKLAALLGISEGDIQTALGASWVKDDLFVPIKTIPKADTEKEAALLQIPGVLIEDKTIRHYPLGEKASQLTGYVQNISPEELEEKKDQGYTEKSVIGKSGLERLYESKLRGQEGCDIEVSNPGREDSLIRRREPVLGEDVMLTIDGALQSTLYDQFASDKGCSVAINPKTGEILALVSTPSYDANAFSFGLTDEAWKAMNADPKQPMLNRFEATFSPGSSFKPVTGAVGIQTGKLDPKEDLGESGLSFQKDPSWGDFRITTLETYDGPANLQNALIYSDNIYFAKAALKIGNDAFVDQLKKMGFGETLPIELGMTPSQISNSGSFDSEAQLASAGFGQGEVLVNPLHMASLYSAFVNDGSMIKVTLEYPTGKVPEFWKTQVLSKEVADTLREDLIQVIENPAGTGHGAQIPGITLAGKTGTAEIKASQSDETGTEIGFFNAFIADPNSEKQLLVVSMVEDVKNRGGSHYLLPKVKTVFEQP